MSIELRYTKSIVYTRIDKMPKLLSRRKDEKKEYSVNTSMQKHVLSIQRIE